MADKKVKDVLAALATKLGDPYVTESEKSKLERTFVTESGTTRYRVLKALGTHFNLTTNEVEERVQASGDDDIDRLIGSL